MSLIDGSSSQAGISGKEEGASASLHGELATLLATTVQRLQSVGAPQLMGNASSSGNTAQVPPTLSFLHLANFMSAGTRRHFK